IAARAQYQHITGHDRLAPYCTEVAVAQDLRRGSDQALERVDRLFGLAFRDVPNRSVEHYDTSDHQSVGHTASDHRNTGSNTKKGHRKGRKLLQEYAETRTRHSF